MSDHHEDAIHPATPIREEQARRDGDGAKSIELAVAIQTLGGLACIFFLLGSIANWMKRTTVNTWTVQPTGKSIDADQLLQHARELSLSLAGVLLPLLMLILVLGFISHICQTGFRMRPNQISPDLNRLAPHQWCSRILGLENLISPLLALPKFILALGVMMMGCWYQREQFYRLGQLPGEALLQQTFWLVVQISLYVSVAVLVTSAADYAMKHYFFQRRIQMTDQQLRDELKMQSRSQPRRAPQRPDATTPRKTITSA